MGSTALTKKSRILPSARKPRNIPFSNPGSFRAPEDEACGGSYYTRPCSASRAMFNSGVNLIYQQHSHKLTRSWENYYVPSSLCSNSIHPEMTHVEDCILVHAACHEPYLNQESIPYTNNNTASVDQELGELLLVLQQRQELVISPFTDSYRALDSDY